MSAVVFRLPFGELSVSTTVPGLFDRRVLASGYYSRLIAADPFSLRIGSLQPGPLQDTYRNRVLRRGVYLGHNIGPPGSMSMEPAALAAMLTEHASVEDYRKLFWSLLTKLYLTILSLRHDSLHLKAVSVVRDGHCVLIAGRSGAGKTRLAHYLAEHAGCIVAGNTHVVVQGTRAWPISSWVRSRNGPESLQDAQTSDVALDHPLTKIVILDGISAPRPALARLSRCQAYSLLYLFSAAIPNYDLKEDVCDYLAVTGCTTTGIADELEADRRRLSTLLADVPAELLSLNLQAVLTSSSDRVLSACFGL